MIDIHSHILPNIDDGADNISESIDLIKKALENGVTDIILTPHYMFGTVYIKDNEAKRNIFYKLVQEVKEKGITVNLYLGNEVFVENSILDFLKDNKIMTLNNSKYLLFELPRFDTYQGLFDLIFYMKQNNIEPVLAHPERYKMIIDNPKVALELKNREVLFQANIGSFAGIYGSEIKNTAILLLKHHCIDFIASDIHHVKHCHYDLVKDVKKLLLKYISADEVEKLLNTNPSKILNNEDIVYQEVIPFKKNIFGKWK